MIKEIRSVADLELIAQKLPEEVKFSFPSLDDATNELWTTRFNNLIRECGCSSGQQFLLLATPVYIIAIILLIAFTSLPKQILIILFIAALIVTGAAGKIAGIIQRNKKIEKLISHFKQDALA